MARGFGTNNDGDGGSPGDVNPGHFGNIQLSLQQLFPPSRPSPEEIAEESRELFINFAERELHRNGQHELELIFPQYVEGGQSEDENLDEHEQVQSQVAEYASGDPSQEGLDTSEDELSSLQSNPRVAAHGHGQFDDDVLCVSRST